MDITGKQIAKYALMPQVMPRIKSVFASGFSYISYNMALVYRATGLLPRNHPYLLSANIGRFGMTHVIAEAAKNLQFQWKYADRIVVFFALMLGSVMLFLQLIAAGAAVFVKTAHAVAMPTTWDGFFTTNPPTHDIAFVLLERVFGVPGNGGAGGFFNSCVSQNVECFYAVPGDFSGYSLDPSIGNFLSLGGLTDLTISSGGSFPSAFHIALRSVMQFYSVGLIVVGAIILAYFVFAVVAETAQTGTPFGKRFNRVWAPLRIVVAFGLLIPVANGLNSGQYITLYIAKWGSSFATNGWKLVNESLSQSGATLLGDTSSLIAHTKPPPPNTLLEFFSTVAACGILYDKNRNKEAGQGPIDPPLEAYYVRDPLSVPMREVWSNDYTNALSFYNFGDIIVRFGVYAENAGNDPAYPNEAGWVRPVCGELVFNTNDIDPIQSPGGFSVQMLYFVWTYTLWTTTAPSTCAAGGPPAIPVTSWWNIPCQIGWAAATYADQDLRNQYGEIPMPDISELEQALGDFTTIPPMPGDGLYSYFWGSAYAGILLQQFAPAWQDDLRDLGWAGAGIWYNRVAWLNGSLFSSIFNLPFPSKYPEVMERVKRSKEQNDQSFDYQERFNPFQSDGTTVEHDNELTDSDKQADALYRAQSKWYGIYQEPEGNVIKDIIHVIFGTQGLYNLVENDANNIHPLAQLVGVGKSLLDSAIRNFGFAGAAFIGGGVASILGEHGIGGLGIAAANIASSIAMIGLSVGFVLYYIIPFMPFIYFFFAVSGWIKGIFEAMVGVPLWALAHLRIDGDGLPGDAAMNGYYLLLEIFLRPILIIFGLIAALQIFAAQVFVLHDIWMIVLANITGFDDAAAASDPTTIQYLRSEVDAFFYTVIYAIVVYMLGMAAFKLIDLIPNHILRWIGASVPTFGEQADDPAANLVRNTMMGTQHIGGAMSGVAQGVGTVTTQGSKFLQNAVKSQ